MLTGREGAGRYPRQRKRRKQIKKAPKSVIYGAKVERFCLKERCERSQEVCGLGDDY